VTLPLPDRARVGPGDAFRRAGGARFATASGNPWAIYVSAIVAAGVVGIAADDLAPALVGAATLLPVASLVRHTGVRGALTEPTPALFIVGFYVAVFPLRALVIAASGYDDLILPSGPLGAAKMVPLLLLASAGTTLLVESYYFMVRPRGPFSPPTPEDRWVNRSLSWHTVALSGALAFLAVAGLAGVLVRYGGISAAQSALLSHSKGALTASGASLTASAWELFAAPAVWCAACVALHRNAAMGTRTAFAGIGVLLLVAMLVVYGSRLEVVLGLIGVWIAFNQSGRRVPAWVVLAGLPVLVVVSAIVLSARETATARGETPAEHYSRILGYGVLDVSLLVWHEPDAVRSDLRQPNRWLDLPGYLVPAQLWPGRPDIDSQRLDVYVARAVGTQNDQETGFPITFLMEGWLLGGWLGALLLAALTGGLIGFADGKVRRVSAVSVGGVLAQCFIATVAFGYYKDGDILTSFTGDFRQAVYLAILVAVTGVWSPRGAGELRTART
jgi:hypothetical protein